MRIKLLTIERIKVNERWLRWFIKGRWLRWLIKGRWLRWFIKERCSFGWTGQWPFGLTGRWSFGSAERIFETTSVTL